MVAYNSFKIQPPLLLGDVNVTSELKIQPTTIGEHITDIYITETGTIELENLSHNIIDIFIIET